MKLRLLPFITDLGARQMALDEALLELAERPTLRIYGWSEPTLSLGYFQDYGRIHASLPDQDPPAIVRRITGGGAIWHEHEVTYCLVGRRGADGIPADARMLYGRLHRAILTAIGRHGREPVDIALQPHTTGDRRYH
ncbi:MAG: lipoate--protein ligase family protein, partial [Planctomycetes bacterium]|nr:lipoate--protein ligase family protein [Planctomycetota bacterium]